MIAWLRSAADAPPGRRKLTGLVWSLLAVVLVGVGSVGLLGVLPGAAYPHVVSIALGAVAGVAGLYGALVGGNAAEHRHAATTPKHDEPAQ
jgi:hypothetical protein